MKTVIRTFFRTLRVVLGPVMLLKERLTQPAGLQRVASEQAAVDQQCQSLALYQFSTCPFCIKVRQEMRRLSLPIEKRDAQHHADNRHELQQARLRMGASSNYFTTPEQMTRPVNIR